jgi:predicted MFS family arabinose efflux permease
VSPDPGPDSHARPWLVLVGCFLLSTGFNAYLFAPASVVPLLVAEFGIDKPAAGLAISAVFLGWVLLQLPGGLLMDRYDNRLLVGGGVIVLFLTALGGFLAPDYRAFLTTRLLGGTAAVFLWTANAGIVDRAFPESSRAVGTGVFIASAPAGVGLAQLGGPLVADAFGWRATLLAYPLVTLLGLPVFYTLLREPVRNESRLAPSAFLAALRDRTVLLVSASSFCAYSLFVFFNSWLPTYGTDVVGLDLATAGALTALVPGMGLLARPGGGWLSDRIGRRRRPVLVGTFLLVLPALVGVTQVSSLAGYAAVLVLAGVGSQLGTGVFYVFVGELSDPETRGTGLAVLTTLSIAGALTAPVVTGWLIDRLSWDAAFGFGIAAAVVGIVTVALVPEP